MMREENDEYDNHSKPIGQKIIERTGSSKKGLRDFIGTGKNQQDKQYDDPAKIRLSGFDGHEGKEGNEGIRPEMEDLVYAENGQVYTDFFLGNMGQDQHSDRKQDGQE